MFDDTVSRGLRANHDIDEENEFLKNAIVKLLYFRYMDEETRVLLNC